MKKLFLLLTTLMLSACGGPSSNSSSGGNDKQNFIYDASGNLIDGKVSLILVDTEKAYEAYEKYKKQNDLSSDEKDAYKADYFKLYSKELCQIVYDVDKTGSYTYSFNIKDTLGPYMKNETTLDEDKRMLLVSFVPSGVGSKNKKMKYSDFNMKAHIEYQYYTGKGIRNVSREKSGYGKIYCDDLTGDGIFKNNMIIGNINPSILESDEDYQKVEGDIKLTFSGSLTVSF